MVHSSVFFKCLEQMTYQLLHLVHISGADASFIPAFGPDVQSEMVQISTANDLSTPAFGPKYLEQTGHLLQQFGPNC